MQAATKKEVKKTVLIVDDSAIIRNKVRELFLSNSFDL